MRAWRDGMTLVDLVVVGYCEGAVEGTVGGACGAVAVVVVVMMASVLVPSKVGI